MSADAEAMVRDAVNCRAPLTRRCAAGLPDAPGYRDKDRDFLKTGLVFDDAFQRDRRRWRNCGSAQSPAQPAQPDQDRFRRTHIS
jgi:hypothetical protein